MKSSLTRNVLVLLLVFAFQTVSAQMLEPVKWAFETKRLNDSIAQLKFIATIDAGWHLYSQTLPENGPLPTEFIFEKTAGIELTGKVKEPAGREEHDAMFDMKVKFFDTEAVFTQNVRITGEKPVILKGTLSYQACNDESCVPGESDFEFMLEGSKKAKTVATDASQPDAAKSVTVPQQALTPANTKAAGVGTDAVKGAAAEPASAKPAEVELAAAYTADNEPVKIKPGEVLTGDTNTTAQPSNVNSDEFTGNNRSLLWFFLQAFFWGLLAIFTPCVFPMIPMTVSYFMKSGSSGKIQAMVYGLSIIAIYVIFGVLIAVLFGADFGNWLSTHWIPNVLFFLIFVVFAASFFGYFEITMPSWLVNKSVQQEDKGGTMGTIFMAFTLVLVSFSCTGPIVGTVVVQAVGGQILKPIIGMLGFSLAFAIPFTLFAFFPQWLNKMPKSGGWLNSVKVVIGFIELAFALKFLNVPDQTYHWGLLDREVYLAFWIVIFTMMAFYLLGKIKFPHDSDYPVVRSFPRLLLIIFTFTFVMYLVPGLFGAPLKAISGWLPPTETQDFDINAIVRENPGSGTIAHSANMTESAKYADKLKLPLGLQGYFDYNQALKISKELNKPVFVDFTGHGCTNCREMENRVWSDPGVLKRLRENFVLVALYVDDKVIEMPEKEWYTNKAGKLVKLLGKKNTEIQTTVFGTNSQPYYVILDGEGKMLVSPKAYDLDVEAFKKFLDAGAEAYAKK